MKLDPKDVEAITGQGVVRHAIGSDLEAVEVDFRRAIDLSEASVENAFLWSNLGQTLMELGKSTAALENLNRAIELDPSFAEARSHRAYLLATNQVAESSSIARAKEDIRVVFESREPKTFWDYRAVAAINAAEGDFERAAKHQAMAESIVRKTGPRRFIQPAVAIRKGYQQQSNP